MGLRSDHELGIVQDIFHISDCDLPKIAAALAKIRQDFGQGFFGGDDHRPLQRPASGPCRLVALIFIVEKCDPGLSVGEDPPQVVGRLGDP
jgi:hypothetical protein